MHGWTTKTPAQDVCDGARKYVPHEKAERRKNYKLVILDSICSIRPLARGVDMHHHIDFFFIEILMDRS